MGSPSLFAFGDKRFAAHCAFPREEEEKPQKRPYNKKHHAQRSVMFIFRHSSRISSGQMLACISPICAFFR